MHVVYVQKFVTICAEILLQNARCHKMRRNFVTKYARCYIMRSCYKMRLNNPSHILVVIYDGLKFVNIPSLLVWTWTDVVQMLSIDDRTWTRSSCQAKAVIWSLLQYIASSPFFKEIFFRLGGRCLQFDRTVPVAPVPASFSSATRSGEVKKVIHIYYMTSAKQWFSQFHYHIFSCPARLPIINFPHVHKKPQNGPSLSIT